MSVSSPPQYSLSAIPATVHRERAAMKAKRRFFSAPTAMLASAALHAIAALVASLLRPSSETQAGNETVRGDRGNELNELQMTFAMDASCCDEKIAWIDAAHILFAAATAVYHLVYGKTS